MDQIHPYCRIVGSERGQTLDAVDADGVVQLSLQLPAMSLVKDYADLLPQGCKWDFAALYVLPPKSAAGRAKYPDPYESGANPDFRPTSASQLENEMRLAVRRMNAATAEVRNAARQKAAAKLDVIPEAKAKEDKPKASEGEVVE